MPKVPPFSRSRRPSSSSRGMALILVLTVIFALIIIATPFVLSMIKQEQGAAVERSLQQSTWGAEGARNWAVVRLFDGIDQAERQAKGGTPYSDGLGEFDIPLLDLRLKSLKVKDPQGKLWGLTVQDEQGKLNVASCPEHAIDTVRT